MSDEIVKNLEKLKDWKTFFKRKVLIEGLINDFSSLNKKIEEIEKENLYLKGEKEKFEYLKKIYETPLSNNIAIDFDFFSKLKNAILESKIIDYAYQIFIKLKFLEDKLFYYKLFGDFIFKTKLLCAGGFSAGKSTFINKFINEQSFSLPINVVKSTAVNSYIFHGDSLKIYVKTKALDFYVLNDFFKEKLDFGFKDYFGISLNKLFDSVYIQVPLLNDFKNLCFIDSPGYNSVGDRQFLLNVINDVESILWFVDIADGTINIENLKILYDLNQKDKEIFIIINKADIKTEQNIEDILKNITDILENNGFKYEGISFISSNEISDNGLFKEYRFVKKRLIDYLSQKNTENNNFISTSIDEMIKLIKNIHKESQQNTLDINEILKKLRKLKKIKVEAN